ncbi:hypothetical protein BJY01DRAFT_253398 [Aspergillus pseudoustus]|uniref:Fungal N-terminal domain-containing protein n=1 Tax=Aspergillus pseudoustus TaxID=1810923 RepID=A0ABR4J183_9EURO
MTNNTQSAAPLQDACNTLRAAYATLQLETFSRSDDSLCAVWQKRVELGICFFDDFCDDFGVYEPGAGSLDTRASKGSPQHVQDVLATLEKILDGVKRCQTLIAKYNHLRKELDVRALEKVNEVSRQLRANQELYFGVCPMQYSVRPTLGRRVTTFLDNGDSKDLVGDSVGVVERLRSLWPFWEKG